MRLTFFGTAAGLPSKERNVTAQAIARDDAKEWYLIDCGEGTQHRLLYSRYTLSHLQAIFITHIHGDHMFGLPGLLTSASMQGRTEPLTICAPEGVESFVRHALACADVTHMPFELIFLRSDQPDFVCKTIDFSVTSHPLSHRVPSFAYAFEEIPERTSLCQEKLQEMNVPRGPLWGRLQHGEPVELDDGTTVQPEDVLQPPLPGRFAVIGGDNDQPELLAEVLTKADVFVHEATFTSDVREKVGRAWMHSTPAQVAEVAAASGVKHLVLTHFSNRYQRNPKPGHYHIEELRTEARERFSGTIDLAEDMGCWELSRTGEWRKI
ncbi:ribonuclease Z [Sansalvadorimonas sp. 2012CJ34-2]|uniref:Ribonuclease Z n=1 Tax=Parendozoicomonas callyspongiae TaxID=2942213 RepID=A0ABT0PJG1_9GAMM|nr:ribonuclease Z [Sansalvadorimonas sp. 2012CJ34-2]MCL6271527.1 ribonuclease Z [Sansalvadorimonas sp. 2012CJ34-2]